MTVPRLAHRKAPPAASGGAYKWIVILVIVCQIVCTSKTALANVIKREGFDLSPSASQKDAQHQHTYGSSYESILDSKKNQDSTAAAAAAATAVAEPTEPHKSDPLETAASYHHADGGKGWMDMGAWAKKKGAFGWYADFPVGKG